MDINFEIDVDSYIEGVDVSKMSVENLRFVLDMTVTLDYISHCSTVGGTTKLVDCTAWLFMYCVSCTSTLARDVIYRR